MKFQKTLLFIATVVWFLYGFGYLIAPTFFASLVDMELLTSNALIDIRSLYGGMLVGIGAWWAYCLKDESRVYMGLLSAFLITFGLFAGRAIGAVISGGPNAVNTFYIVIEGVVSSVMLLALRKGDLHQSG